MNLAHGIEFVWLSAAFKEPTKAVNANAKQRRGLGVMMGAHTALIHDAPVQVWLRDFADGIGQSFLECCLIRSGKDEIDVYFDVGAPTTNKSLVDCRRKATFHGEDFQQISPRHAALNRCSA